MTNAFDPTLALTPSVPFAYGDRPKNQWRQIGTSPKGAAHPYVDHELVIQDLGGGINKVRGEIFAHYLGVDLADSNRTSAANGVDVSYPGQAILSTFMNSETVWEGATFYAQTYIYDNLFIGGNSTANKSLWKENASTGGLAAVTFSPGGVITCLYNGVYSNVQLMTIGMKDTNAKTLASDLSTTTTMASTATLWGGILSPLNADSQGTPTNLLYLSDASGGTTAGISTLSGASASTANSVATGTKFNPGGYAVGIANVATTPGNLVPRAVWVVPQGAGDSNPFMANSVWPPKADIYHTNLYGTDPQKLITNLPWVTWCTVNEGVLYYTDGFNICMNDGKETDLGWVYQREQDSDYKYLATGLGFARGQLVVAVSRLNLTTVASSQMWLEKYDPLIKQWFKISSNQTPNVTSTITDAGPGYIDRKVLSYPAGSLPYSLKSQMLYLLPGSSAAFPKDFFQFIPPSGYSHFWNYRYTAGSTKAGQKTEASGTWDSPALSLPWPLKGMPTVCIGIGIYGDMNAGGTGGTTTLSTAKVELASQGITGNIAYSSNGKVYHTVGARDGYRYEQRWISFGPERWDPVNYIKWRLTITQDDSRTDWTGNPLPIVFRFRTFTDGVVDYESWNQ